MSAYKLEIHESATADIQRIVDYLKDILYSKQAAFNFLDGLEKKYKNIVREPHLYPGKWIRKAYYRKAMVRQYIIIFRIDEPSKTVHIIAVGHSRQRRSKLIKR